MVILWYSLLTTFCVTGLAMIRNAVWYCADPGPEPWNAFVTSIGYFIAAGGAIIVQFLFDTQLRQKRSEAREKRRSVLDDVLDSLDSELKNFCHLAEKRPYSGHAHQKAVEVYSFECMRETLEQIQRWWGYHWKVKRILGYLKAKDLQNIISSLEKLRPVVERDLRKQGGSAKF
jgi:hypothetical protein